MKALPFANSESPAAAAAENNYGGEKAKPDRSRQAAAVYQRSYKCFFNDIVKYPYRAVKYNTQLQERLRYLV